MPLRSGARITAGPPSAGNLSSTASASEVLDGVWRLDSQVALRPERFGALAYHFGTRRLSFLKSRKLLSVLTALDGRSSARAACSAAGVEEHEMPEYERALETLLRSGMLTSAQAGS